MGSKVPEEEFAHVTEEEIQNPSELYPYWPAIIGLATGGLAITAALLVISGYWMLGATFAILFLLLIFGFIYQEIKRWPKITAVSWKMMKRGGVSGDFHEIGSVGFPTAIFLLTELMLFAGAFAMYFFLRSGYSVWPPIDAPHLDTFIPSLQTGLLIISSVMIEYSLSAVKKGNQRGITMGFLGATILGLIFFLLQFAVEWPHLMFSEGLMPSTSFFGASFFLLTGFHGAHVFAGVIVNAMVTARAYLGHFSPKSHGFLEAAGTYWHFVHIVWLFLFAFLWQGGLGFLQ